MEGNIEKDMDIYDLITDILYFNIPNEKEFDTEETFIAHNILYTEEIEGQYFNRGDISDSLKYIIIN